MTPILDWLACLWRGHDWEPGLSLGGVCVGLVCRRCGARRAVALRW